MKTAPAGLTEPRSFVGTACVLGALTALPFALFMTAWAVAVQEVPLRAAVPAATGAGLLFGAIFGLVMACFLKGETATVEVADSMEFVSRVNVATSQIAYYPSSVSEGFFTYKPSFQAGLAAGRISVQLREGQAVIVGPRMYVNALLKRLA